MESSERLSSGRYTWRRPSLATTIALVILVLSLLYAVQFSRMVYDSLIEQVIAPHYHAPRFKGHVHYHNTVEWILLVVPAAVGWAGTVHMLMILGRRWLRPAQSSVDS